MAAFLVSVLLIPHTSLAPLLDEAALEGFSAAAVVNNLYAVIIAPRDHYHLLHPENPYSLLLYIQLED